MSRIQHDGFSTKQQDRKDKIEFLVKLGLELIQSTKGVILQSDVINHLTSYATTTWYVEKRKAREYSDIAFTKIEQEVEKLEKQPKQGEKPLVAPRQT